MDRRRFLTEAGALATLVAAGCLGDGGGDGTAPEGTPTATDSPTPTPTATDSPTAADQGARAAYPDYNWAALEGVEPEATTEVSLRNTAFHPPIAAVQPGATVTFVNDDSFGHTVTIPAIDVDRDLGGGESTTVSFDAAGTYDYVCELHPPGMLGRVVVRDGTPTASPTPTETSSGAGTPTETPTSSPSPTPTPTEDDGGYY